MSEMIDRVAKAIAEYWEREGFDPSEPSAGAARAAIEAMREPTDDVSEAVRAAGRAEPGKLITGKQMYQAVIDAALKDAE